MRRCALLHLNDYPAVLGLSKRIVNSYCNAVASGSVLLFSYAHFRLATQCARSKDRGNPGDNFLCTVLVVERGSRRMKPGDKALGMDQPICRRDFLNSTLLASGSLLLKSLSPLEMMA